MPTTKTLTHPTIHLNGSGRQHLLDGYSNARDKVRELESALMAAAPNGRDYYPQGESAIGRAIAEHCSRLDRLRALDAELAELQQAVADASGRR
jgi:hypothetical protein